MRSVVQPLLAGACGAAALLASTAEASPLTAEQILRQFNLVTFGDLEAGSTVEGRTYVGGDLKGNSATFYAQPGKAGPSEFAALLVGGDVTGGWKNVNGAGDALIAGDAANMNMNGGKAFIGGSKTSVNGWSQAGVDVVLPDGFEETLRTLSLDLAGLDANSAISFSNVSPNQKATFDAAPDADGLAVFYIADGADFFASIGEIAFNLNGAETIVINVGGAALDVAENFLGNLRDQLAAAAIWNFYEAETLNIQRAFHGSVLAPFARLTNGNELTGSIVAKSMRQGGAVRLPGFAGDLPEFATPAEDKVVAQAPEPAMGVLLLAGGLLVLAVRRARA